MKRAASALPPIRFEPVLKDYLWGGTALRDLFGRELPSATAAESWEVSDHPHGPTPVREGELQGATLNELIAEHGTELLGTRYVDAAAAGRFPLLIKILDARRWLSVQVHPGDAYAREREGDSGKTEMWIVLDADPEAEIILGFAEALTAGEFNEAVAADRLDEVLQRLPARAGDAFFVRSGLIHAIGPGLVIAEIQQSSDTTYRVHDWGRHDRDGRPRELHLQQARDVLDFSAIRPAAVSPEPLDLPGGELLVDCPDFRVERYRLGASPEDERAVLARRYEGRCAGATFEIWGVLDGSATLEWDGGRLDLEAVDWVLLPATLGAFAISAEGSDTEDRDSPATLVRVLKPDESG